MADATDEVIGGGLAVFHGHDLDGICLVVRAQNQVLAGGFHVFDGTRTVLENGIHVELAFAIGLERVVVTVDEKRCPGKQTGVHTHAFAGVGFDDHEAFPLLAVAFSFRFEFLQETPLKFQDVFDVHAGEEGTGGSDGWVGEEDVLELVVAGRQNGSTFIDLGGIEQIENGKVLNGKNAIHAFEAEAALAVQEVGDVGLLETSLLRQTEAGKIAILNAFPKSIAEIFLQHPEFHAGSIA